MEAVLVVDAVEAGHVDVLLLFFVVALDVFGDEAEGLGCLTSAGSVAGD